MKPKKILLGLAGVAIGLMAAVPSLVLAHCYAGQVCVPDPCNTHHGGTCSPEIQKSIDAMQIMQKQASSGAVQKIFTVVEIETLEVPANSSGNTKIVPVEIPTPGSSPGSISPFPQIPMTPTEFAKRALPIRNAQDLDILKQGVLDTSRELLDVAASEASDKAVAKKSGTTSGRMLVQHLNFTSATFIKLKQYSKIMEETRDMIGQGDISLIDAKWTEIEKLNRYTQSIIQQEGEPDK